MQEGKGGPSASEQRAETGSENESVVRRARFFLSSKPPLSSFEAQSRNRLTSCWLQEMNILKAGRSAKFCPLREREARDDANERFSFAKRRRTKGKAHLHVREFGERDVHSHGDGRAGVDGDDAKEVGEVVRVGSKRREDERQFGAGGRRA